MTTPIGDRLSLAEQKVLNGLLNGLPNRAIAKRLGISDKTVKNHVGHILTNTGTTSRLGLVIRVYKSRERMLKRRLVA